MTFSLPKRVLFQTATQLPDKSMVGLFFSKSLDQDQAFNFGVGFSKAVSQNSTVKVKVDKDLNATAMVDHRLSENFGFQAVVSQSLVASAVGGVLDKEPVLGIKLKFDN